MLTLTPILSLFCLVFLFYHITLASFTAPRYVMILPSTVAVPLQTFEGYGWARLEWRLSVQVLSQRRT